MNSDNKPRKINLTNAKEKAATQIIAKINSENAVQNINGEQNNVAAPNRRVNYIPQVEQMFPQEEQYLNNVQQEAFQNAQDFNFAPQPVEEQAQPYAQQDFNFAPQPVEEQAQPYAQQDFNFAPQFDDEVMQPYAQQVQQDFAQEDLFLSSGVDEFSAQQSAPPQAMQKEELLKELHTPQPKKAVNKRRRKGETDGSSNIDAVANRKNRGGKSTTYRPKNKRLDIALNCVGILCCVFLAVYTGVQAYASSIITTGETGIISKQYSTPPEFASDEINILVAGIDYTDEDGQGRNPIGNTDVIMYVRFNFADNSIRMLQIPRDTYAGTDVAKKYGSINEVYYYSEDENNRMNSLAHVLYDQYKLPVDSYVTIDMDSLSALVDLFGGVEVYVSEDMEFDNSELKEGTHVLMGDEVEFFVRYRGFTTADIGRLDNQRFFYSAIFSMIREASWQEITRMAPIVQTYVNTDLSATDCASLAIELLKVPSSQIMMATLPVADAILTTPGEHYKAVAVIDSTADLLNQYFRAPGVVVPAEELNIAQIPHQAVAYDVNVQWMSEVDEAAGNEAGQAADATQTGEDLVSGAQADAQAAEDAAAAAAAQSE